MINSQYFNRDLPELCEKLGGNLRFEISLAGGPTIAVYRVDAAHDGYVLLTVLPDTDVDIGSIVSRMGDGGGEVFLDRMAVPYSQIAHVRLTPAQPATPPVSLSFKPPAIMEDSARER